VPAWLSGERAIQIYEEIKTLTIDFVDEVRSQSINGCRSSIGLESGRSISMMLRMKKPM